MFPDVSATLWPITSIFFSVRHRNIIINKTLLHSNQNGRRWSGVGVSGGLHGGHLCDMLLGCSPAHPIHAVRHRATAQSLGCRRSIKFISAIDATLQCLISWFKDQGKVLSYANCLGGYAFILFFVSIFLFCFILFTYRASDPRSGILLGASYVHLMSDAEEEATIVSSSFGHFVVAVGASTAQAPPGPSETALTPSSRFPCVVHTRANTVRPWRLARPRRTRPHRARGGPPDRRQPRTPAWHVARV